MKTIGIVVQIAAMFWGVCFASVAAEPVKDEAVPEDTCILQLQFPEGATVDVDGRDYGQSRRLVFSRLQPGKSYGSRIRMRLPGGKVEERTVLLEGGRLIHLTRSDPRSERPELEPQNARFWDMTSKFSPDGRWIAFGGNDAVASVWDVESGKELRRLVHQKEVLSVALSPDGYLAATVAGGFWQPYPTMGAADCVLAVWDAETGSKLVDLADKSQYLIAFSPSGRYVLTGGDNRAILWNPQTGARIRTYEGHANVLFSVGFSPDEKYVLTTARDSTAILWDTQTGKRARVFHCEAGWVRAGAFTADSRRILTGAGDGVARLWDISSGEEIVRLLNVGDYAWGASEVPQTDPQWLALTPEGLFDGSERGRQTVTFRVGGGLNIVPVERFFQDFFRPGLLAEIWGNQRPLPTAELGVKLAPQIRIVSPQQGGLATEPKATIEIEVTDRGGGISGPWLLHNGAKVLARAPSQRDGMLLRQTVAVPLIEGDNRLEVHAASEDGSWESEPAVLLLRYEQSLTKAALYLVAIGINHHAQGSLDLRFAAADAQAIAKLFETRGAALYGPENIHVTTLLDDKATKEGVRAAIAEVAKKAQPQDTLLAYLAGHGMTVGQRYYFIPHEFKAQAEKLEQDIQDQGLPGDVLGDWLAAVPALKRVVIFDTCQSGGAISLERTARSPFAFRGALERLSRAQGIFTIAATAAGDEAQEVPELGHGVLTYALLAGLGAVDSGPLKQQVIEPKEGKLVEVRDWFSFAQDKVPRLTGLYFGREQFVGFSGHGQSFPLLPLKE